MTLFTFSIVSKEERGRNRGGRVKNDQYDNKHITMKISDW